METLEQIPFEEPAVNSFVLARNPSSPNEYMPQIKSCSLESLSVFEIRHKCEQVFQQKGREQRKTKGERQQQNSGGSKETSKHMRIVHQTLYCTWLYWVLFLFFREYKVVTVTLLIMWKKRVHPCVSLPQEAGTMTTLFPFVASKTDQSRVL